jgi:hypothetical protein
MERTQQPRITMGPLHMHSAVSLKGESMGRPILLSFELLSIFGDWTAKRRRIG